MIYKIKALYDNGNGSSVHSISEQLCISRNTVRKYLRMNETEIVEYLKHPKRAKVLDGHRGYMIHLLQSYPKLSSGKLLRKLKAHGLEVEISHRSVRRYVQALRSEIAFAQKRYYEPILDHYPGVQCQVDGGELRGVLINGRAQTVYFLVFVLSFSRMMYVSLSIEPIATERFILMHDQAFRFFDGLVEECVYDQTKLVVIKEEFRELWLNQRFHQYANTAGFKVRVCEGYDPESKGKVEAGVKYVKNDFFYSESFQSFDEMKERFFNWLKKVANVRIHGTTHQRPWDLYEQQEQVRMKPYLSPQCLKSNQIGEIRQADKTALVSFRSNKYSVPSSYQSSQVLIHEIDRVLFIYAMDSNQPIAQHRLSLKRGEIIKDGKHYRSRQDQIARYEKTLQNQVGVDLGKELAQRLKTTVPDIYKDQLMGLLHLLNHYPNLKWVIPHLKDLAQRPQLRVSFIRDYLSAVLDNPLGIPQEETLICGNLALYSSLSEDNTMKEVL